MKKELSPHQTKVLDAFTPNDTDIYIHTLYNRVYGINNENRTVRYCQQKLAPTFLAINKKLEVGRIVPGKLKQTYRLDTTGEGHGNT